MVSQAILETSDLGGFAGGLFVRNFQSTFCTNGTNGKNFRTQNATGK